MYKISASPMKSHGSPVERPSILTTNPYLISVGNDDETKSCTAGSTSYSPRKSMKKSSAIQ